MVRRTRGVWPVVIFTVLVGAAAMVGTAAAQKAIPRPQNKLAIGEDEVMQLLLLMDTDKRGKISKQEFMGFMQAEFERLDKDKTGELDVNDLTQSNLHARSYVGK